MFVYLFTFAVSIIFFNMALSSKHIFMKYVLIILSALPPILLAGLRNEDIGADMQGYGSNFFYLAKSVYSWKEFLLYSKNEIGYAALNYICSRFSDDIHFFLIVHQTIVMTLVIMTALKQKNRQASLFILAFYFLFLYNTSLSMMRQIISVGFILYGTALLIEGKKIKFVLFVIIAQLFHNSGIIALAIPVLYWIVKKYENRQYLVYLSIIAFVALFFAFFKTLLGSVILTVTDKYENYLIQTGYKAHKIDIVVFVVLFVSTFITGKKYITICNQVRAFIALSLGLYMLGSLFETANRMVYNIVAPLWILLSAVYVYKRDNFRTQIISIILLFVMYAYRASDSYLMTIPYKSEILGIN